MVALRCATTADCQRVWEWANDPVVRAASFSQAHIPFADHERWFHDKLADAGQRFFIVTADGVPVGQIRFDVKGVEAEVHINIAGAARGHGYGGRALQLGCEHVRTHDGVERIVAHVKPENTISLRLFTAAGFVADPEAPGPAASVFRLVAKVR